MAVRGLVAPSPRSPKSDGALGEVSGNETGIWEASQCSFDGCWPLSLLCGGQSQHHVTMLTNFLRVYYSCSNLCALEVINILI